MSLTCIATTTSTTIRVYRVVYEYSNINTLVGVYTAYIRERELVIVNNSVYT